MASPDPETAGEGWYEFGSSIRHQGTVYPVTVVVVPFLVELATPTAGAELAPVLQNVLDNAYLASTPPGAVAAWFER